MKLSLFNTLTRKREDFKPLDSNLVKMYVCGPTVYDHPHIGNARSAVVYDLLYRTLTHLYGKNKVLYVRNITDVDDKIMDRASELGIAISKLTKETTINFHEDMEYLGCLPPNKEPKATEHISEMIDIIQKLLDQNIAYKAAGHVYFDVSKAGSYTALSGRSLEELRAGVRIEDDKNKKHSADFVLWKPANEEDDISTKFLSPFGVGRPGWHIECSAMSNKFLGPDFDIHGGGIDLIFPHHTNEIAQSSCAFPGSSYAKYWIHNGFLTVNHEKMSKSLGNFITVKDLRDKKIKGDVVRLLLLTVHYRKPLDYNEKATEDAQKMLNYWYRAIENIEIVNDEIPSEFLDYLLDDLNTHLAIKLINDFAKQAHANDINAAQKMVSCARFLGLMRLDFNEWFKGNVEDDLINQLIAQRLEAKKEKNWILADEIRDRLTEIGVVVEDKPDGSTIWKTN
jgi:cysteinyl-tRNA synthetase